MYYTKSEPPSSCSLGRPGRRVRAHRGRSRERRHHSASRQRYIDRGGSRRHALNPARQGRG